jgi:hypothetical protein
MKPKFLLAIITLNTLSLAGSMAILSSINPEYNIAKLSQTISKIVGFNGDDPNLVESAIDRALRAKEKAVNLHTEPKLLGDVAAPPPPTPPEILGGKG